MFLALAKNPFLNENKLTLLDVSVDLEYGSGRMPQSSKLTVAFSRRYCFVGLWKCYKEAND